jgi:hypothetical protein
MFAHDDGSIRKAGHDPQLLQLRHFLSHGPHDVFQQSCVVPFELHGTIRIGLSRLWCVHAHGPQLDCAEADISQWQLQYHALARKVSSWIPAARRRSHMSMLVMSWCLDSRC